MLSTVKYFRNELVNVMTSSDTYRTDFSFKMHFIFDVTVTLFLRSLGAKN